MPASRSHDHQPDTRRGRACITMRGNPDRLRLPPEAAQAEGPPRRRGHAVGSIARSAPPGAAAPLPRGAGPDAGLSRRRHCYLRRDPLLDFKMGSPGAGDDSSPYFCDSPNEPAGPGQTAAYAAHNVEIIARTACLANASFSHDCICPPFMRLPQRMKLRRSLEARPEDRPRTAMHLGCSIGLAVGGSCRSPSAGWCWRYSWGMCVQ